MQRGPAGQWSSLPVPPPPRPPLPRLTGACACFPPAPALHCHVCCGHKDCESLVECAPTDKYCVITQASEYPTPSSRSQRGPRRRCRRRGAGPTGLWQDETWRKAGPWRTRRAQPCRATWPVAGDRPPRPLQLPPGEGDVPTTPVTHLLQIPPTPRLPASSTPWDRLSPSSALPGCPLQPVKG